MPRPVPHKKHTNLTNEITGSYHNDRQRWKVRHIVAVNLLIILAALLILGEFTGLTSKLFGTV